MQHSSFSLTGCMQEACSRLLFLVPVPHHSMGSRDKVLFRFFMSFLSQIRCLIAVTLAFNAVAFAILVRTCDQMAANAMGLVSVGNSAVEAVELLLCVLGLSSFFVAGLAKWIALEWPTGANASHFVTLVAGWFVRHFNIVSDFLTTCVHRIRQTLVESHYICNSNPCQCLTLAGEKGTY